jgi:hypothetical protein
MPQSLVSRGKMIFFFKLRLCKDRFFVYKSLNTGLNQFKLREIKNRTYQ